MTLPISFNFTLISNVAQLKFSYFDEETKTETPILKGIDFSVKKGDSFCQGMFVKYLITDDDSVTNVRKSGIGSTDRKDDK